MDGSREWRQRVPLGRRSSRRILALVVLILFTILLVWFGTTQQPTATNGIGGASLFYKRKSFDTAVVDRELVPLLVKQTKALEAKIDIEDFGKHADKFMLLSELHNYSQNLSERHPGLNASQLHLYQSSIKHHHDNLVQRLIPYINKTPKSQRTIDSLMNIYGTTYEGQDGEAGIIIPVGTSQFQYAVHLIATLKYVHKTTLPIQVVYAGNNDLSADRRAALRSISPDVETINLLNFFDESLVGLENGGWAIKIFALLASNFKKVMICDADAVFFQDPRVLFEDPGFVETGTLFYRDREIFPGDGQVHKWWHSLVDTRKQSESMRKSRFFTDMASREEMESGVVAFDKGRREVVMGLLFIGWMNTRKVREEVTYKNTYGDKESFWMGFELVQIPYHLDEPYASMIGQLTHPDQKAHSIASQICSDHMLHLDKKKKLLWFNGSIFQQKGKKDNGFFFATHWAPGTVMWDCDHEPWCMTGIREEDAHKLTPEELSILNHMIGTAMSYESKFPGLVQKHY